MEKATVIASLRAELSISESLQEFFSLLEDKPNAWFTRQGGDLFLSEFGHEWNTNFIEVVQSAFDAHFRDLGLSENRLPTVKLTDSRRGSWIMEAALTMFGTVGTTYTVLKGIAELPKLADGLEETKKRIQKELNERFRKKIPERIEPFISNFNGVTSTPTKIPANPVNVTFSIDARPLRGLTPEKIKSHSIHLSVGVSRSSLSIENLGDAKIENLRIGLFKDTSQRHSWSFADAFSKSIPCLSGKQSISLTIGEFHTESDGSALDLLDDAPLYVDCWLQDNSGIYLFNFYLEQA